jgi:hypothetical protein
MDLKPRAISLHIEEIVLHGVSPADRERVGDALKIEIARLLTEQGLPPALLKGGEMERADGGAIAATDAGRPDVLGAHVARAVVRGLGGT